LKKKKGSLEHGIGRKGSYRGRKSSPSREKRRYQNLRQRLRSRDIKKFSPTADGRERSGSPLRRGKKRKANSKDSTISGGEKKW